MEIDRKRDFWRVWDGDRLVSKFLSEKEAEAFVKGESKEGTRADWYGESDKPVLEDGE